MIQQRVIQAFEEEKARSKLPGYVPSYDDFEPEVYVAARGDRGRRAGPSSKAAEKPRGPHKAPAQQPHAERQPTTASGGIFE